MARQYFIAEELLRATTAFASPLSSQPKEGGLEEERVNLVTTSTAVTVVIIDNDAADIVGGVLEELVDGLFFGVDVVSEILNTLLGLVFDTVAPPHPPEVIASIDFIVAACDPDVLAHAVRTCVHELRWCAMKWKDPITLIENDADETFFENLTELVEVAFNLDLERILLELLNEFVGKIPLTPRAKELERMTESQRRLRYHKSMSVTAHEDDHDHLHRMLTTKKNYLYMVVQQDFRMCKVGVTKADELGLLRRYTSNLGVVHEHLHVQITSGTKFVRHIN